LAAVLAPRGVLVQAVLPGFVETEGFPQRTMLASRFFRRVVLGPEDVAEHVLHVLDRGRRESFVPGWYRAFALAQAVAPSLVARVVARAGYRRP
jgi:short-subunit dehydrogenase